MCVYWVFYKFMPIFKNHKKKVPNKYIRVRYAFFYLKNVGFFSDSEKN